MSWDVVSVSGFTRSRKVPSLRVGLNKLSFNSPACCLIPNISCCDSVQVLSGAIDSLPVLGFRFGQFSDDDSLRIVKRYSGSGSLTMVDVCCNSLFRQFFGDLVTSSSVTHFEIHVDPDDSSVLYVFLGVVR